MRGMFYGLLVLLMSSPSWGAPDAAAMERLTTWYQAEMQKLSTSTQDPAKLEVKMQALTADFQSKMQKLMGQPAAAPAPTAAAPEKFIGAYVEPYYVGPEAAGTSPKKIAVAQKFDDRLLSTVAANIAAVRDEIRKDNALITPMTFFVLSARLYDVGMRDDAVFWFYAAKDRVAAVRSVGNMAMVGGALEASHAFSELLGPFINGYAFCDIDRQLKALLEAAEWSKKNPYAALLKPGIHREGIDPQKLLALSAEDRIQQAGKAAAYFNDPGNRAEFVAQRKASGADAKFCWK